MSFNYSKNKDHANNESFWTSYSDLFLGLSSIFLLLYVTASLRSGTDGIKNQVENQKLSMKVQDLENQLKMYESVKQQYLETQAPQDEQQEYTELMDKLTLLQEEARDEKSKLQKAALDNEHKEKA
ncbi:MAG: microtubule-binding protein, partial [Pseudobdellovibrionaceae bacterium]